MMLNAWKPSQQGVARPELLVVARTARKLISMSDAHEVAPGMASFVAAGVLRVTFIELDRVPAENGAWGLHLLLPPSNIEAMRRFMRDPTVPDAVKMRTHEAMMQQKLTATDEERAASAEWLMARGRARGLREGRRQGRQEGRQEGRRAAALMLAAELLDPHTLGQLEQISDVDQLERAVLLAIRDRG